MKRTSFAKAACPVARTVDSIGDWWSLLIVRDALDGIRRFSEFQRSLGISRGILASRLKRLVKLGILETAPAEDGGAHQDYILTRKGMDLFLVVASLRQWGQDHAFGLNEPPTLLIDNKTNRPVERLALRSKDGRLLTAANTTVRKAASQRVAKA